MCNRRRRRPRKDATSCWECKRRKIRCHFPPQHHGTCAPCRQRGSECRTQQPLDPRPSTNPPSDAIGTQALLIGAADVYHEATAPSPPPSIQLFNSSLVTSDAGLFNLGSTAATSVANESELSRALHSALPSQNDANIILGAGHTAAFLQFFTLPYADLFSGCMRPVASLAALPSVSAHPVLLARSLLYLANGIQNLDPSSFHFNHLQMSRSLDFTPARVMKRYLHVASRLVTSNSDLIESLEGLECLVLEAVFHTNAGDLRHAWLIYKRAIGLAQLMGMHVGNNERTQTILDSESIASPAILWYRIVGQDRYLALVLGLPPATNGASWAPTDVHVPDDCETGQLERQHCVIMGRMADRLRRRCTSASIHDINEALQNAAQTVAPTWWLLPRASHRNVSSNSVDNDSNLEHVMRLLVQITHYNLLVILHLPAVASPADIHQGGGGEEEEEEEYIEEESAHRRTTCCANASRELLSRYIRLRCMRHAPFCCRMIDFCAFTACLALLTAHMSRPEADALAHQRQADRATVVEVTELMLEEGRHGAGAGGGKSILGRMAQMLGSLSAMERHVAAARCREGGAAVPSRAVGSDDDAGARGELHARIPLCGRVRITCDGIFSADDAIRDKAGTAGPAPWGEGAVGSWTWPLSPSLYLPDDFWPLIE